MKITKTGFLNQISKKRTEAPKRILPQKSSKEFGRSEKKPIFAVAKNHCL
jgi:hypothetical protein